MMRYIDEMGGKLSQSQDFWHGNIKKVRMVTLEISRNHYNLLNRKLTLNLINIQGNHNYRVWLCTFRLHLITDFDSEIKLLVLCGPF